MARNLEYVDFTCFSLLGISDIALIFIISHISDGFDLKTDI